MTTSLKNLSLESSVFEHGAAIPKKYTADGADVSPPLKWSDPPPSTKEFVLIVDDPDAPTSDPWAHWVLYKIPASVRQLPEGLPKQLHISTGPLAGAVQGHNSWAKPGWNGPSPPKGHGVHHYHFTLYALDRPLLLSPDLSKKAVVAAMKSQIVGEGELIGTYERK
jgi:Raf kinase inhibitor-like YbhB/YbcL family protein